MTGICNKETIVKENSKLRITQFAHLRVWFDQQLRNYVFRLDMEGCGQMKWLNSSFSSIIGGYWVMTITLTETMCMVSRREECDCSHIDSVYVMR